MEPILKHLLGGDANLALYNQHYSSIVTCFIVAYGLGFLVSGRLIDRIGTKKGLALSIVVWRLRAPSFPLFSAERVGDHESKPFSFVYRGFAAPVRDKRIN